MSHDPPCIEHAHRLADTIARVYAENKCDCLLLSGGIDTSFIAVSLSNHGLKPLAVTIVYDEESPDYKYSKLVAERLGLRHIIFEGERTWDLVEECLSRILRVFKTIDPIEVVCDIPLCMGLTIALNNGCKCVMTGDGGDELFFGYNFLYSQNERELKAWIRRVIDKRFSSEILGDELGVRVIPAYYASAVKEYSRRVPFECRIRRDRGRIWGKYLLRIYLGGNGLEEIAWREKTPVNLGSGFHRLLALWSNRIILREALELYRRSLIHFPSKPHAYLYSRLLKENIKAPERCSNRSRACPICGRCLTGNHCYFCGASIGERVMVYSDELYHTLRRVMST